MISVLSVRAYEEKGKEFTTSWNKIGAFDSSGGGHPHMLSRNLQK
jgi:hypothetical protein